MDGQQPKPAEQAAPTESGRASPPKERELRIARARRAKILKRSALCAAAVVVVVGGIFLLVRSARAPANGPGTTIPDQGAEHIALGTPFEYNSNPPTSGPHFATPAEWGVYQEEIADQILIHNLEHGGVWISYTPGLDPALVAKLEGFHHEFGRKIIVAPRAANDTNIALAAWNHLDKFSAAEFSEERVRAFIKAYRNRGPEFVP